jgi:vancomycin resistance protein YoaR
MTTSRKRLSLFIAVPLMLLLLPLSIYFVDTAAASDKVSRNVSIEGEDVSRFTEEEAINVASEYADALIDNLITVSVEGTEFSLDPADIGTTFDIDGAVSRALTENKNGLTGWLRAFSSEVDVPVVGAIDPELLDEQISMWEATAIEDPAFEGSIEISDQKVEFEYPHAGPAVDRDTALDLIQSAVMSGASDVIELPLIVAEPTLTVADIDAGVKRTEEIIDRGVTLTNAEYEFEFFVNSFNIARSLEVKVVRGNPATITYALNPDVIAPLVRVAAPQFQIEPVDAYWDIIEVDDHEDWPENYKITDSPQEDEEGLPEDDVIELIPSKFGTRVDVDDVTAAVEAAALGDGTGDLPLDQTAEPEFTTEDALAYGELYEVSEFTTFKPGVNRAHNIDLMADTIDGHIVWPGETFSINEFIGPRTLAKGYKHDCAIVGGELSCEQDPVNVGGGVSQFGTTIFNAIFFGCYEDIVHQPHSIYFSKYPEGREATLGFPSPDVAFLNNTEAPVIIKTSHTRRSITVSFFGNNGGIRCDSERSERSNISSPVLSYQTDPEVWVAPGAEKVKSAGSKGWSVTVTRVYYDPNGNEIEREPFFWRYRGEKNVILLHPCDVRVGGDGECPDPVPGVVGMTEAAAKAAIEAAGYSWTVVYEDPPGAADRVFAQTFAGEYPEPGTVITIKVDTADDLPPDP